MMYERGEAIVVYEHIPAGLCRQLDSFPLSSHCVGCSSVADGSSLGPSNERMCPNSWRDLDRSIGGSYASEHHARR